MLPQDFTTTSELCAARSLAAVGMRIDLALFGTVHATGWHQREAHALPPLIQFIYSDLRDPPRRVRGRSNHYQTGRYGRRLHVRQ
jgi:hypothetical protein